MAVLGRRALVAGSAGLAAAAALARPSIARAADKTLTVWWNQGFYAAEDQAFRNLVAAWEKQSGIKVNLSLVTGAALDQKVVSALTTGQVPDLIYSDDGAAQTVPQAAWDGKLIDVSDVVETQKGELSDTALRSAQFYDSVAKKRSFYGVPFKAQALNMPTWKTLVEKAGYQMSDIPKTWDKFFDFFEPVQKKLRAKGMRHVYGLGLHALDHRRRPEQPVQPGPGRLWRRRHRHTRRQAASGRREGARGDGHDADPADDAVQAGLRAARCHQLGRSGQQQRLPFPGSRDDAERHDLDLVGGDG